MIELKLPDEVMDGIPTGSREDVVKYLSKYFDGVIDEYSVRLQRRAKGVFGEPISKYERSMLKDFLIDQTLGKLEETSQVMAAETLAR